ncbi:MAG: hypothetical protein JO257_27205 [Deltaproteobacteria bacterium]|nr:hypothetical protein [Deltaproteobacteria bacterium]
MRIACIHIPQFALQCASRLDPALRGAPVVVVGGHVPGRERSGPLHTPVVMACSRAAWALGVRLGMTAASARARSPELTIVTADPALERETVRAIADAALGLCEVVDIGGRVGAGGAHLAMYCAVPGKTRGTTFGDRLLAVLEELGLTGRIGIADDRFTAWVAASNAGPSGDDSGVTSVPRGGSAAFLAARPLSLLAIPTEVQHMLEALGVRTLGEFAALPAPSVQRPSEADYQALARGESGTHLRPYVPEAPVREEILVGGNVLDRADALSGPAAVALVARRLELRLGGRARHAAQLEVTALPATGSAGAAAAIAANANEPLGTRITGPRELPFGERRAAGEPITGPRELPFGERRAAGDPITGPRELPVALDAPTGDAAEIARVLASAVEAAHTAEAGAWKLRVVVTAEAVPGAETREVFAEGSAPVAALHPLSVVLATSGSLFALSPPDLRAERRDAHRRTRRGKQRRGRPTRVSQAKLFDRRS